MNTNPPKYVTLKALQAQKSVLQTEISKKGEEISNLWGQLFTPKKANTKGELVTAIISNSITAFDTFMIARKLMTKYGHLFKKKKKRS